jgi:hypothetical protein
MPGANKTKKVQQKKVHKKEQKAILGSNIIAETYFSDLKNGNKTPMFIGLVTKVIGGGRFQVFNIVDKVTTTAKISNKLFTRKAKHRNATIPIAVHVDSYVIVDESDTIKSVIGEGLAYKIRNMLHEKNDDIFNRGNSSKNKVVNNVNNVLLTNGEYSPKINLKNL